jgi:hypothetical protein
MQYARISSALVGSMLLALGACSGVQQAMNDLNKPAPKVDVPDVKITTSSNSNKSADGGAAAVATTGADGGPLLGSCDKSCEHYLGCKKIGDPSVRPTCVQRCAALKKTPQELGQFEAMDCDAAVALVDGPSLGPGLQQSATPSAPGAGPCPPPVANPRSAEEEKVFQATTKNTFCGWTYNKTTGSSKEMRLRFLADGTMIHQHKTERTGNTTDGYGNVTGSFGVVNASGDKYCWRYSQGNLMYSPDGATFTAFVSKVEDNGHGVVFFQTKLGEYKVCN